MNRKINMLLLVALLASLVFSAAPAFAAGEPIISIPIVYGNQGDTFNVAVLVDTQGAGIRGYSINLDFDKDKIQINSVDLLGLGDCPGGYVEQGHVVIENDLGTMRGASERFVGCPTKTVRTPPWHHRLIAFVNVTVKAGAANGRMNWTFAANTKLIDAADGNMLPPEIVLYQEGVRIGPGPKLGMRFGFGPHYEYDTFVTFDATVTVTNNGDSASDPDTVSLSLSNTTPARSISCAVPSLLVGDTATCEILGAALSTGAGSSVATAVLAGFGTTETGLFYRPWISETTTFDASFGAFLEIASDGQVFFVTVMHLGPNSTPGNLNVKCNTNYQVDIRDDNPTAWHMTEYDGTNFKANKLIEPLRIRSAQHEVTAGTPAALVTGGVAGQNGDAGQDFPLTYSQVLKYADPLLPAGETYHLVLTLNAYVTM